MTTSIHVTALDSVVNVNSLFTLIFEHLDVNKTLLRVGMVVSGAGSVAGCLFLMLALINVVQIKVGTLACGSGHASAAVVPLV
ncbi:maternal effect embryo arrest 60 [Hibiscus trionum]|uniref:Maternal effect embryo arrest 60 n=1 Tax=Hibiscus trionum TaxID=183268 RepID=A0A9W7HMX9_HIBTR|nr:maternal effect embryo arrest 60 [Hibiscus trionum]